MCCKNLDYRKEKVVLQNVVKLIFQEDRQLCVVIKRGRNLVSDGPPIVFEIPGERRGTLDLDLKHYVINKLL